MKKKKVLLLPEAEDDIDDIKDSIISISRSLHIAEDYADNLRVELKNLSTYGSALAFYARKSIADRYGIYIRRANTKNKKIAILYYVEPDYIIVKKIVWASSIE
jgi:plasmid stabilization system protein ParE